MLTGQFRFFRNGSYRKHRTSAQAHLGGQTDAGIFAYERLYNNERALVVINTRACVSDSTGAVKNVTYSNTSSAGAGMKVGFADGTKLKNVYPDDDKNDTYTVAAGAVDVKVPCQGFKILVK